MIGILTVMHSGRRASQARIPTQSMGTMGMEKPLYAHGVNIPKPRRPSGRKGFWNVQRLFWVNESATQAQHFQFHLGPAGLDEIQLPRSLHGKIHQFAVARPRPVRDADHHGFVVGEVGNP